MQLSARAYAHPPQNSIKPLIKSTHTTTPEMVPIHTDSPCIITTLGHVRKQVTSPKKRQNIDNSKTVTAYSLQPYAHPACQSGPHSTRSRRLDTRRATIRRSVGLAPAAKPGHAVLAQRAPVWPVANRDKTRAPTSTSATAPRVCLTPRAPVFSTKTQIERQQLCSTRRATRSHAARRPFRRRRSGVDVESTRCAHLAVRPR